MLTGLKLYGAIAAGLAVLALLGTIKVQHGSNVRLRDQVAGLKQQYDAVLNANEGQAAALDQCKQANDQWVALGKDVAELKADLAELDHAKADRAVLQAKLTERVKHASPQCQAILRTDFGASCGDIANGLRDAAQGHR